MSLITETLKEKAAIKTLVESWKDRLTAVEKVTENFNYEKRIALAKLLENTQSYLNHHLMESRATQSSNIGQFKRFALDALTVAIPSLIAFDLVSVQPISNRVGMINYIEYTYNSNKGTVKEGQIFTDTFKKGNSEPTFTLAAVNGEAKAVALAAAVTGTLNWKPATPGSITIKHGTVVITDDGAGNLESTGNITDGEINYTTGEYKYTLSVADLASVPTVNYSYNNEFVPANDVPQVGLQLRSLPVQAKARHLSIKYAFEAGFELSKEYDYDINVELSKMAAGELNHEIDIEITNDLYDIANEDAELVFSKAQPIGVNLVDHYDAFSIKLSEGAAKIYAATQRVQPNWLLIGINVLPLVSNMRAFKASGVTSYNGPYFAGTLNGYKVFVSPSLVDANAFILGFKGERLFEAGYVYAPYMPIMQSELVTLMDMSSQKGLVTMYATKVVNPQLYIRGKITA